MEKIKKIMKSESTYFLVTLAVIFLQRYISVISLWLVYTYYYYTCRKAKKAMNGATEDGEFSYIDVEGEISFSIEADEEK